jgi:hypothetical protein
LFVEDCIDVLETEPCTFEVVRLFATGSGMVDGVEESYTAGVLAVSATP